MYAALNLVLCASWRHSTSLFWTFLLFSIWGSTSRVEFLVDGILRSYPYFTLSGETPMETWSCLLFTNSAVAINTVLFNRFFFMEILDWSSVQGWYTFNECSHIPWCALSSFVMCNMKIPPLSEKMVFLVMHRFQTCLKIKNYSWLSVIVSLHDTKWAMLVNCSITASLLSNQFESGSAVIKSQFISVQGPSDIWSGLIVPSDTWWIPSGWFEF